MRKIIPPYSILLFVISLAAWHSYGESATQGNGDHALATGVSSPWLHPLGENDTAEDMLETMRRLNKELIAEYELGILAKYAGIPPEEIGDSSERATFRRAFAKAKEIADPPPPWLRNNSAPYRPVDTEEARAAMKIGVRLADTRQMTGEDRLFVNRIIDRLNQAAETNEFLRAYWQPLLWKERPLTDEELAASREKASRAAAALAHAKQLIAASNHVIEEPSVTEKAEAKEGAENIVGENGTENVKGEEEKEKGVDVAQEEDNVARDKVGAKTNLRVAIIFLALLAAVPMAILARRKFNRS